MRKLIKLALITLGIRAFLRWRKSRQGVQAPAQVPAADPADELRRKLAETRDDHEAPSVAAEPPVATVTDRRADVHEQGRATLDAMKSSDEG